MVDVVVVVVDAVADDVAGGVRVVWGVEGVWL